MTAPSSIADAPTHVMWSVIRDSSLTMTRMYSARLGMLWVNPISFSAAIAQPTLLIIGET